MTGEMWAMIDGGWTVTWLMVDGKYVVTATRGEDSAAGIGTEQVDAWAVLKRVQESKGL